MFTVLTSILVKPEVAEPGVFETFKTLFLSQTLDSVFLLEQFTPA